MTHKLFYIVDDVALKQTTASVNEHCKITATLRDKNLKEGLKVTNTSSQDGSIELCKASDGDVEQGDELRFYID